MLLAKTEIRNLSQELAYLEMLYSRLRGQMNWEQTLDSMRTRIKTVKQSLENQHIALEHEAQRKGQNDV